MKSEWKTIRAADFMEFNPRMNLKKGTIATKISMDKLQPYTKKIPETEQAEFSGGTKFSTVIRLWLESHHVWKMEKQHL